MPKTPIQIRVDDADLATWREKAREGGQDLSEWIRGRCNGGGEKMVPKLEPIEQSSSAPAKPKTRKNDEPSSIAESVAGRTGHEAGCDCFQCVQVERFYRSQRGGK